MEAPTELASLMSRSIDQTTEHGTEPGENDPRFVICIDYGTTFTGAGWCLTRGQTPTLSDIRIVQNWAGGIGAKVPSVFTYSANSGQSSGYGIGDQAYIIRWTKLKLERPRKAEALKEMKQTLLEANQLGFGPQSPAQSEIPRHLIRTSAETVADYLTEVFNSVRLDIENQRDRQMLEQFPIDLVITHPAVWDDRAKNITFRAVLEGFEAVFSDLAIKPGYFRLAAEPEACARYTAQAAQDEGMISPNRLRPGECFIVVDAGGGTVDLVSYLIEQVSPEFKVKKVTASSSGRYGATCIDNCFLDDFLPQRLNEDDYKSLLNMGGPRERHGRGAHTVLRRGEQIMLKKFEAIKRDFKGRAADGRPEQDSVLDLPLGIGQQDDPHRNIRGGQLFISCDELEEMFRESVDGVLKLIQQQLLQVDRQRLKVGTIFLSGGFSHNEYLFKCVNNLARSWRFSLLRGKDCWTAVVKGGVLMGLGVGCNVPPAVSRCPYGIGVVVAKKFAIYNHVEAQRYVDTLDGTERARNHVHWVVSQGDLIMPDAPTEKAVKLVRKLAPSASRSGRVTVVISSSDGPYWTQSRRSDPNDGSRREVHIDYDLATLPAEIARQALRNTANPQTGAAYQRVEMQLEITISQGQADFALVAGKTFDMMGRIGQAGYLLGIMPPLRFPRRGHE